MMKARLEMPSDDRGQIGQPTDRLTWISHFQRPGDVVRASGLSVDDKRAILASWASDRYAVESRPALRFIPELGVAISVDDVQAALKDLDRPLQTKAG
jgi:hypothetical protein